MKSLDKSEDVFYIEHLSKADLDDKLQRISHAQKMADKIKEEPNLLIDHPEWNKYKDLKERAKETRERNQREKPGVQGDEKDETGSLKSMSRREIAQFYIGRAKENAEKSADMTLGPKEGRVPVMRNHKGRPSGKAAPSAPPSTMKLYKDESFYIDTIQKANVATVGVLDGSKILMGKRNDNGKWTNPGGHMEDGEDPQEAAKRELHEEAGLKAKKLKHLGSGKGGRDGQHTVHAFVVDHDGSKPHSKNDPDKEVKKWEWIETKGGMPQHVIDNLHSPKNVVLAKLGLIKSDFYINDLIKARPHKYLRKYRRGTGWVYIYHEPGHHGKAIEEETYHKIKKLAETNSDAKALLDTLEAHDEKKLKILRELADLKNPEAIEHLKSLGIDRAAEKLEDTVMPAKASTKDDSEKPLGDRKEEVVRLIVKQVDDAIHKPLSQHTTNPLHTNLSTVSLSSISNAIGEHNNIRDMLIELHKQMKRVDAAHKGIRSQQSRVNDAGGYGNLGFNQAVQALQLANVVPRGYSEVLKRTAANRAGDIDPPKFSEIQKRVERERRERTEREARERAEQDERDRRDMAEIHGSMAHFISSIANFNGPDRIQKTKRLHAVLRHVFGKDLKKEDWPYNFEGFKTKIKHIDIRENGIHLEMQVFDANGNDIMDGWSRTWSRSGARPNIENNYMGIRAEARNGARVGAQINAGQRKLLKSIPGGGTIHVHANIDVGGYNWSNQGFSWDSSTTRDYRYRFKNFMAERGHHLTDADLAHFKDPVHFAAFDDGKKYVYVKGSSRSSSDSSSPLSELQKSTRSLSGVRGEFPLTEDEISSGKSKRMLVHAGKLFMLNKDWYGTWDSASDSDASKFADRYEELRERATKFLSPQYREVSESVKQGGRATRPAEDRSITPRSSLPAATQNVQRYLEYWRPRGARRNITMSPRRLSVIKRWPRADIESFINFASITPAAKRTLREHLRSMPR